MPGTTTRHVDLGHGFSAEITTEVSGEGNGQTTFVTTNLGALGRKMRLERTDDSIVIETDGEWEAASMANLLRALVEAMRAHS